MWENAHVAPVVLDTKLLLEELEQRLAVRLVLLGADVVQAVLCASRADPSAIGQGRRALIVTHDRKQERRLEGAVPREVLVVGVADADVRLRLPEGVCRELRPTHVKVRSASCVGRMIAYAPKRTP